MERLDEKILCQIFLELDCFNELLQISMVCHQWRKIIIGKDFLRKRFIRRQRKYLIHHWKFDRMTNLAFDSHQRINQYFQTGHLIQDICFLGSCLIFDAHSSITIPLNNQFNQQYSISVWIQNTSSVNSWRTIFDIVLSQYGFIHFGITPKSKIENQFSFDLNQIPMKCRSDKQTIVRYLWYHLVILISQDKQQLFINGQCQREIKRNFRENNQLLISMKELNIGTNSKGFHCWFGRIADLSIWNRWLDLIEIRAIWHQRVSIDRTDLGEYFSRNFNTKKSTHFRSVLL